MSKLAWLMATLVALGFVAIAATGVDLVYSRIGIGMLILGSAVVISAFGFLFRARLAGRWGLTLLVLMGSAYFVWRAFWGGPLGLAVPDAVQVLVFLGVYFSIGHARIGAKRLAIIGIGLACVAHLGVAAVQYFEGNTFYVWKENPEKMGNTTGLFGHYNPFSAFLNGSVFFFLSYLCIGGNRNLRVIAAILVVCSLLGVVASGSRGGWVSLILGSVAWMVLLAALLKKRNSRAFGPVVLMGVLFLIGGVGSTFWAVQKISAKRAELVSEATGLDVDSKVRDGGRLVMQQMALEIFLEAPALGQGARSFSYLSLENWDPKEMQLWMGNPDFAHSEYMQTLSDYGALGLVIILILLIGHGALGLFHFLGSGEEGRQVSDLRIWQLGAAGGLVAILAQCFFSFLIHVPALIALVAIQLGILASVEGGGVRIMGGMMQRVSALLFLALGIITVGLGWRFSQAFLSRDLALGEIPRAMNEVEAFYLLSKLEKAGEKGWDQVAYERAGQEAMRFAMLADEVPDPALARKFRERAKAAFKNALQLNPHSPVALCGLPQVEDALGNFEAAEEGHELAMKKLWSREIQLRPHFFAARSAYTRGYQAYTKGRIPVAEKFYRLAQERILKLREILDGRRELEDTKRMRLALESWLAYVEGVRLVEEGDRVWSLRPRKPENAERAHALMLAAETRYLRSQKVLGSVDPQWRSRWDKLQENLELFKMVKIPAANLTPEEIEAIANPEAVLDSSSQNR